VDRLEEAGEEGEGVEEEEQRRHQSRFLRLYPADDGTYVLRGRLDPEVGALLEKALEWASDALYRETATGRPATNGATEEAGAGDPAPTTETATAEQRRADALGLVAERAMTTGETEQRQESGEDDSTHEPSRALGRADRFQVVLHVEAAALMHGSASSDRAGHTSGHAVLADSGVGVPAGTSRRLACDASVVLMTHDQEGRVLTVGRKRRTVPPAIRRALDHRDPGCRFPGCGCRYTDAHHIIHWANGGETKLDNLTLLCKRHHRAVHEEGLGVEVVEGGPVRFFRPDGREIPQAPLPPPLPAEPAAELVRAHSDRGITPDAWTPTPLWNGEALDYGLAIDMLRPLKARAR
jgi:5-methylcytosine-specific restriction endonuclease McrA